MFFLFLPAFPGMRNQWFPAFFLEVVNDLLCFIKRNCYKREFIQFLHIAEGSLFEVVTLSEIFRMRKLFSEEDADEIRKRCEQIDRKLNGLINSLRGKKPPSVQLETQN